MSPLLALGVVLLTARSGAPVRQEPLDSWFPRLESAEWSERELAQRRLAAALEPGDAPRVRAALIAGGPETRLRLAHVLAEEERLFGTAAALAVDADEVVGRAGTTALRLAIERSEPWAWSEALPRTELWTALERHDGALLDARSTQAFVPAELCDLLTLAAPRAPGVVLDPSVETADTGRRPRAGGTWRELARDAAQRAGGTLEGYGLRREPSPHVVRWIAIVPRGADAAPRAGELVERWCRAYATPGDEASRAAAARALCAHGIPTVVAWLARDLRERGDGAALSGLLLAARRGEVPAALQEPAMRARLHEAVERAGGGEDLYAAIALAGGGAPRGTDAARDVARVLAATDPSQARRAHLALVVLEGWASPDDSAQIRDAVRALLARADLAPGLRFQALRVAARLGLVLPLAGDAGAFLVATRDAGGFDELARLLRGAPNWPPDVWAADGADPALREVVRDDVVATALVGAWTARGAFDPAAQALARLANGGAHATDRLRELALLEPRLREVVERAARANGLAAGDAATWSVLAGVATEAERRERLAELAGRDPATEAEWLALGELCAGATGPDARVRLTGALTRATPEVALAAARRAVLALRADLDDAGERELLQSVRGAVRAEPGSAHDRAFRGEAWPPLSLPAPRVLRELDRDPARGPH